MKSPLAFLQKNKINPGAQSEHRAEEFLRQQGLILKHRNYRTIRGEIDLIMQDGETLVFIEVRLRRNPRFTTAIESVTRSKQCKIIRTAKYYLQQHKLYDKIPCRFDIIAWDATGPAAQPQWIKNAFTED